MRKPGAEFAMTGVFVIANEILFKLWISEAILHRYFPNTVPLVIANEKVVKLQASESIPA